MSDIRARRDAVLKSSISIKAIGNSVTNFTKGLFKARSTASEIAQTTNENNKFKRTLIGNDDKYFTKRRENARRIQREDELEASTVQGVAKRQGALVSRSTKGFLGRILDFFGIVLIGWFVNQLPGIIKAIQGLIRRIRKVTTILTNFIDYIGDFLTSIRVGITDAISKLPFIDLLGLKKANEDNDRLTELENDLRDVTLKIRELSDNESSLREGKGRIEVSLESNKERLLEIIDLIEKEHKQDSSKFMEELDVSLENEDEDEMQLTIDRLKRERDDLGGVNLKAEEEAEEIKERISEIKTERDDLVEAIKKLRTGINDLNKEGRQRMQRAFHEVNEKFQDVFKKFFGGGNAELQFIDSDDPLEAGLEVFAQLPGKKLIEMSSLSGGEKGLVSLSLIFAVFLTNPSPICVLDEVDAALDDSNVEKFCDLIEDISSNVKTRFLVITHHPLTMARMDRLYGVTMQEKGVSQLVSVDLNVAEKIRNIA